ncbi:MAG: hypothetical protein ACR2FH_01680 [Caulobacteraceae bacterium]
MIVIHIGLRKAGSSSIQGFLAANAPALAAMGVDYPAAGRGARTNHANLAHELRGRRQFDPRHGTLEDLAGHWRASPASTLIVSAEALEECESAEAARLGALLARGGEAFRIVLVLRDLDELMASSYARMVKVGRQTHDFDAYSERRLAELRVDYVATAARWADAFGWESLEARLLDHARLLNGDLIDDFLGAAGVDPAGAAARRMARPGLGNAAPGWRVVEAVRALYAGRHGLGAGHPLADPGRHGIEERKALGLAAMAVGEARGWNADRGRYLTADQAARCVEINAAAIEALNRRLSRPLPAPASLEARGFEARAFVPDAAHIPPADLRAFYDDLGEASLP